MNSAAATQTPATAKIAATRASSNGSADAGSTAPARRFGSLRRTMAGVLAATTIAFGGVGMLSATDASAAGVRPHQTYVVQSQTVQVETAGQAASRGSL